MIRGSIDLPDEKPNEKPAQKSGAAATEQRPSVGRTMLRLPIEARKRGFDVVLGVAILAIAAGVAIKVFSGPPRPSKMELTLLYPYGPDGQTLPNGRVAPPAMEVQFDFMDEVPCKDASQKCLRYRASKSGTAFDVIFTLQNLDGNWVVVDASQPK